MDFDLVVNSRRSIRKFTDDVVSDSDILKIIECGIKAPSAKNRQPWRVKVVSSKDKDMIASFLESKKSDDDISVLNTANVIREANKLILVFATPSYNKNDVLSIGAFIENMCLKATEMGLGSLWIANTDKVNYLIKDYFEVDMDMISCVAIGYKNQEVHARPRKSIDEIVLQDCAIFLIFSYNLLVIFMNYKVAINPVGGGSDTGLKSGDILEKDVSLLVSNYIKGRLDELGIENVITRTTDDNISLDERIDFIDSSLGLGDDVIVITNGLSSSVSGVEIIYALRDSSSFARTLAQQFLNSDIDVNKYYQLRMEEDTFLDSDYIIRNTGDSESVIINYASVSNSDDLNNFVNNYEDYGEAVVRAIAIYTKNDYVPTSKGDYYTVKKGDSLYSIARLYDVSVADLKIANKLTSNVLSIGQVLKIPDIVEKSDTSVYYVKKGDSLYGIAKSYGVSVEDIKKLNNLSNNNLSIGQELLIPGLSSENVPSVKVYTVVKGDSLYKIANLYGVSVDDLKSANKLSSSVLSIGQQLVIPDSESSKTYVVKRGDTLYSIARDNNTTVDRLKILNGLVGNTLSVGQVLKL